jgi:hypothetical protein
LNPDQPGALYWRGAAKEQLGDFAGVKRDFDMAEALKPQSVAEPE